LGRCALSPSTQTSTVRSDHRVARGDADRLGASRPGPGRPGAPVPPGALAPDRLCCAGRYRTDSPADSKPATLPLLASHSRHSAPGGNACPWRQPLRIWPGALAWSLWSLHPALGAAQVAPHHLPFRIPCRPARPPGSQGSRRADVAHCAGADGRHGRAGAPAPGLAAGPWGGDAFLPHLRRHDLPGLGERAVRVARPRPLRARRPGWLRPVRSRRPPLQHLAEPLGARAGRSGLPDPAVAVRHRGRRPVWPGTRPGCTDADSGRAHGLCLCRHC